MIIALQISAITAVQLRFASAQSVEQWDIGDSQERHVTSLSVMNVSIFLGGKRI
jgi:hypothetical protein